MLYSVSSVSVAGLVKNLGAVLFTFARPHASHSLLPLSLFLMTFGTVETNPGPTSYDGKLHFGFWNLDSLLARDGVKNLS